MIEIKEKEYCFVIDAEGTQLAPTSVNKGWYLIRKGRAKLVEKYPMVIQLNRKVDEPICETTIGIDDGSKYVGFAIVQECTTKNKCVFKGTLHHRNDVKKLMTDRAGYRRIRRANKRYRPARFDNRANSTRTDRLAPTILQKKQAIMRFMNKISQWINIGKIILEDVAIDIRALTDEYKPYGWQYQKSNRLDENLRKATVLRDGKCMMCGRKNITLQAHHITPKRLNGADTIKNLISLCSDCHEIVTECEMDYAGDFYKKIDGKNLRFDYGQHVMQGKHWLQEQLNNIAPLQLTNGGNTANVRIDWGIDKSHANDAVAITGLFPNQSSAKNWEIKPKRKKRKMKCADEVCGFRHGDYASYVDTKGIKWVGYITAMYHDKLQINIQTLTKHLKRVNARKSILVQRCPQVSIF